MKQTESSTALKLQNLEIRNVGVHKHLKIKFEDGLTGIFGPQGSGKSTVIGCVYAAITNDFSRISDLKQGAICQQAEEDESSLKVLLEASGNKVSISRVLAPNSSNRLVTSTGVELTNDNKIKEEMAVILGASRGLLDNYVFVDQWEIRSLFKANLSQRNEALALLCGTKFIDACYGVVSKARDAEKDSMFDGLEDAGRLASELAEYEALLEGESRKLETLRALFLADDVASKLMAAASKLSNQTKAQETLKATALRLAGARKEIQVAKGVLYELSDDLQLATEKEAIAREALGAAKIAHTLYEAQLFKWGIKDNLQKDLADCETELRRAPPTIDAAYTVESCNQRISEIDSEMAPYAAIISHYEKLPDSQVCPTCGSALTELKAKEKEAREKIAPFLIKKAELIKIRTERIAQEEALENFEWERAQAEATASKCRAELEKLKGVMCPKPPDVNLNLIEANHHMCLEEHKKLLEQHSGLNQELARLSSTAEHLEIQKKEAEEALEEMGDPDATALTAQDLLGKDQEHRQAAAASMARCDEYRKVIKARIKALEEIKAIKAKVSKTRGWADLLDKAAAVLHKDGLPRVVHNKALREVEEEVNKTLTEFESPFRIRTGDNLTYIAKFCNGTEVPAHRLSGGQQVILSLAMRWAFNSLFASQIGFLALDEPTAGLDEQHLGLLQSTLSKLGAAARNKGCQVVIITHEKRLMGVFDHVIELNRPVL